VIKLENVNNIIQQYIGSTLKYNIQLAIIITQIDDEGDHTPIPYEVKKGIYPNVFEGIKELILSELDNILNFISIDQSSRDIVINNKQEDNIRTKIIKSLENNQVNFSYSRGFLFFIKPKIEFYQECLIDRKTFNLPRTYKITYQTIVKSEGKPGKLALQAAEEQVLIPEASTVEDPKNWIILPANNKVGNSSYPNILVSTERSHSNNKWGECQTLLHSEQEFMLTIRQFVDFINLLRSGNVKYADGSKIAKRKIKKILNEIIKVREPSRAEWLDAGIDLDYWLSNSTSWGIPKTNIPNGSLYYWHPRDTAVVRFGVNSGGVGLNCGGNPRGSGSGLWVRRAKIFRQ
ncbi:hypothetical protein J4230_05465, partial [Candidatus Woesearchaeota archaeon]|nr:hypothetical protein [Candidatus Woesearchaeota archaeon]